MKQVGRYCQVSALAILPLAMVLELTNALGRSFGLSQMLVMLVFGILLFMFGRLLEGYAPGS